MAITAWQWAPIPSRLIGRQWRQRQKWHDGSSRRERPNKANWKRPINTDTLILFYELTHFLQVKIYILIFRKQTKMDFLKGLYRPSVKPAANNSTLLESSSEDDQKEDEKNDLSNIERSDVKVNSKMSDAFRYRIYLFILSMQSTAPQSHRQ